MGIFDSTEETAVAEKEQSGDFLSQIATVASTGATQESQQKTEAKSEGGIESGDAVVLFEDEKFIFTSEGVLAKDTSTKVDNSRDAEPKTDEKILGKFENYDDLVKSYKELERKLGENSEAVNKLKELNPVLPMLEAMLGDETFLGMAESYFTDPSAQSEALKKQLGLDNDFIFDLNNALSDPKSEDAKVLNKVMQARQPKTQPTKTQTNQTDDSAERAAVIKKYNLSESDYDEMMSKARQYKLSHDDIYFILNRDKIIKEAEQRGQQSVKQQVNTAQSLRTPVRGGSTESQELQAEDSFMAALKVGKGLFED